MQKCKFCGAGIEFIKLKNGKLHPVDAKPRKVFVVHNEGLFEHFELVSGYESHFATCPDAEKARKK